jgi:hypothetical protein
MIGSFPLWLCRSTPGQLLLSEDSSILILILIVILILILILIVILIVVLIRMPWIFLIGPVRAGDSTAEAQRISMAGAELPALRDRVWPLPPAWGHPTGMSRAANGASPGLSGKSDAEVNQGAGFDRRPGGAERREVRAVDERELARGISLISRPACRGPSGHSPRRR